MKLVPILLLLCLTAVYCVEKRIIDGQDAEWGSRTYLAQNLCNFGTPDTPYWAQCGCTSTILSPTVAITAGHCLFRGLPVALRLHDQTIVPVKTVIPAPGFAYDYTFKFEKGLTASVNDVGIQTFDPIPDGKVQFFPFLNNDEEADDVADELKLAEKLGLTTFGTLFGWGITTDDYVTAVKCFLADDPTFICPLSQQLQQLSEYTVGDKYVGFFLNDVFGLDYEINDNLRFATPSGDVFPVSLLTGQPKVGGCVGDSGGPLIWKSPFSGREFILGLYSDNLGYHDEETGQSYSCGNGLDVLTRLDNGLGDWIKTTAGALE